MTQFTNVTTEGKLKRTDKIWLGYLQTKKPCVVLCDEDGTFTYNMESGLTIKPSDANAYHKLCLMTTVNFARIFIDEPDSGDVDKAKTLQLMEIVRGMVSPDGVGKSNEEWMQWALKMRNTDQNPFRDEYTKNKKNWA